MDTRRTGTGAGIGTRTGTDPIIRIDIPVQQIEATHTNNPITVRSGNWICAISQQPQSIMEETGYESDLEVNFAFRQSPEGPRGGGGGLEYVRMLAQYSHLSVAKAGDDGHSECLQEVTIRQPDTLLQGVKVYVEPGMVEYRRRYVFDIQVHTHKNNHPRRQQQPPPRLLHPQQSPCYKTPALPTPVPLPIPALRSSDVFVAAKQRLKAFLDLSRGSDFQISFNQPHATATATATPSSIPSSPAPEHSTPVVPSMPAGSVHGCIVPEQRRHQLKRHSAFLQDVDDRERRGSSKDTDTLFLHSCIMSTVTSPAMQYILNTYPPPSPSTPSTPPPASTTPTCIAPSPTFAATHAVSGNSSSTHQSPFLGSESTFHPALLTCTRHDHTSPFPQRRQQQPIRKVRFQDVPPEVVRAVVRYIYLGQKPILEPYCGYTVKDLMALSSYLEIAPLEDYCVQLVLGTHHETDTSTGDSDNDFGIVNNSHSRVVGGGEGGGGGYARWTNTLTHRGGRSKSQISPEMAVKVLFDWGYRYTKVRAALVCVLIDSDLADEGPVLFGSPEGGGEGVGLLRSFAGHEAFHAILCEIVEWQLSRRLL